MADKRTLAIVLGASLGVAAVAAVAFSVARHRGPATRSVNELFDEAHRTLEKLQRVVDSIKSPEA